MTDDSSAASPLLSRTTRLVILAMLFFSSGAAGLVYEVAWSRRLELTFGSTTYSIGTVLARGSYSERFGLSDTQIELEAYPRFRPGTYGYINLGASFDKALYPSSRVGLELFQSLGGGFEGSLG